MNYDMLKTFNFRLFFAFTCLIFFSCVSNNGNFRSKCKNNSTGKKKVLITDSVDKVNNISVYISKNDSLITLLNEKNLEYENLIVYLNDKIELLDKKMTYVDSVNSNISTTLLSFQDDVELISKSYNEISQVTFSDTLTETSSINDDEFRRIYIESLAFYQNAEWEKSLEGFQYLLSSGNVNIFLDNCQYWLGEIYFKMKKYHKSIDEFNKIFLYLDSNKRDDSLYRLANCYMLLEDEVRANEALVNLIDNYPNSEYVKKAKKILK